MSRVLSSSLSLVSSSFYKLLSSRNTLLSKPLLNGISDLVCCALMTRSVNTMEWASVLPRDCKDDENRHRYIRRFFAHPNLTQDTVMPAFIAELVQKSSKETLCISMDQSKIGDGFECLMISLCLGNRAVPLLWKVVETKGEIGGEIYIPLLEKLVTFMEKPLNVLLLADRFYGNARLIQWCQKQHWQYRIRLRKNLILQHDGGEIQTGDVGKCGGFGLSKAQFHQTGVFSNIGFLQEKGYSDPWIIAMDSVPNRASILDYGRRWAIEPMFSDFKSRGFNITQTKFKNSKRIEGLMMILTLAIYWAVSTGARQELPPYFSKKKPKDPSFQPLKQD